VERFIGRPFYDPALSGGPWTACPLGLLAVLGTASFVGVAGDHRFKNVDKTIPHPVREANFDPESGSRLRPPNTMTTATKADGGGRIFWLDRLRQVTRPDSTMAAVRRLFTYTISHSLSMMVAGAGALPVEHLTT
jgi:hypothetical protein